jgi:hypothetical protein
VSCLVQTEQPMHPQSSYHYSLALRVQPVLLWVFYLPLVKLCFRACIVLEIQIAV